MKDIEQKCLGTYGWVHFKCFIYMNTLILHNNLTRLLLLSHHFIEGKSEAQRH